MTYEQAKVTARALAVDLKVKVLDVIYGQAVVIIPARQADALADVVLKLLEGAHGGQG